MKDGEMPKFSFREQVQDKIIKILSFWVLLFAISPFAHLPWGTGYRYLLYVGVPLSLLVICLNKWTWAFFQSCLHFFIKFIYPFIPFLIGYLFVRICFFNTLFDPEIKFNVLCLTILSNGLVFSVLAYYQVVLKKEYFFYACAFSCCIFLVDVLFVAFQHSVPIWSVRQYVSPYSTIYAKCISLIGGLTVLGAFICRSLSYKIKICFITIGILSFFESIGILLVRATLCVPFLTFFSICFFINKTQKKLLILSVGIFSIFIAILFVVSPLGDRLERGYNETIATITDDNIASLISKTNENQVLTDEEKLSKKKLNTSMGGRVAVWNIAKEADFNTLMGSGLGKPEHFANVKDLFSYSKDYLPHFHSDYLQCFVVGGIVLLFSLGFTQILLFKRALEDPILLYLFLSLISFGIVDLGFLDVKVFACFMGAWMAVSLWKLSPRQGFDKT